jgi:hypothetical protein
MRRHGARRGVQFRGCIALYFLAKYGGHPTRALLRDAAAAQVGRSGEGLPPLLPLAPSACARWFLVRRNPDALERLPVFSGPRCLLCSLGRPFPIFLTLLRFLLYACPPPPTPSPSTPPLPSPPAVLFCRCALPATRTRQTSAVSCIGPTTLYRNWREAVRRAVPEHAPKIGSGGGLFLRGGEQEADTRRGVCFEMAYINVFVFQLHVINIILGSRKLIDNIYIIYEVMHTAVFLSRACLWLCSLLWGE